VFIRILANLCCDFPGEDLAERGAQETSSVVVETVQKVAKSKQVGPVLPLFKSDASKVTSKGMGLKKAYLQKQNMFTVHAGDAGIVTSSYVYHHDVLQMYNQNPVHVIIITIFLMCSMSVHYIIQKH
jgi:hypothetical protein